MKQILSADIVKKKTSFVFIAVFLVVGFALLKQSNWSGSTQLHTYLEIIATLIAFFVGISAFLRYSVLKSNTLLFVSAGFLGIAFLDGYHGFVTSPEILHLMPSPQASLSPWSWMASRLFASLLFFASWFAWYFESNASDSARLKEALIYSSVSAATILSFVFFAFYPLPRAYYPEFVFGRPQELIAAFFFMLALIGYYMKGEWKRDIVEYHIIASLIISFFCQLLYMASSMKLFDVGFDSAHILKILSYLCIMVGLLRSMYAVFKAEAEGRRELESANRRADLFGRITMIANQSETGRDAISDSLQAICELIQWPLGHVYFVKKDKIIPSNIWYCKDEGKFEAFVLLTQRSVFKSGVGGPGRVYASRKPIWLEDVSLDESFIRLNSSQEAGIKSAFFSPIYIKGNIVAIFEFFSDRHEARNDEFLFLLERASSQISLALERERIYESLVYQERKSNELAKEAMQAAAAKSAFLANMSHEIRTPMNAILGFSELLAKSDLSEKQRGYLDSVTASGALLVTIIDDILDISKLESGKITLERIDFDLDEVLHETFRMIVARMQGEFLQTYIDIHDTVPMFLKGDPTRLKQILINLLSNALKFTSEGSIGVIVKNVSRESSEDSVELEFTVKDTGIGIELEKQKIIFDSFSQADETTTRKYGGTGLGLSIAKAIVEALRGRIWVESDVGEGSEFKFIIPLQKSIKGEGFHEIAGEEEWVKNSHVFIIDDSQVSLQIIERCCKLLGLSVSGKATSPYEALEKLDKVIQTKGKAPTLILCDIIMEGMDGFELVKTLRKNENYRSTKFMAVTADIDAEYREDKNRMIFDAFVTKPVSLTAMKETVKELLGLSVKHETKSEESTLNHDVRILVAEDVATNQKLIKEILKKLDVSADFVSNGSEAVEKLRAGAKYDLILMDMQMPVMGGVEATHIIRTDLGMNIPIIALTAAVLPEDKEKAKQAGMTDFLGKPIKFDDLKQLIHTYTRKSNF